MINNLCNLLKEFENLYRVIVPSLMSCNFCNKKYYFRSTKSSCIQTIECKTSKTFKPAKINFMEKCTDSNMQLSFLETILAFLNIVQIILMIQSLFLRESETEIDIFFLFSEYGYMQKIVSYLTTISFIQKLVILILEGTCSFFC